MVCSNILKRSFDSSEGNDAKRPRLTYDQQRKESHTLPVTEGIFKTSLIPENPISISNQMEFNNSISHYLNLMNPPEINNEEKEAVARYFDFLRADFSLSNSPKNLMKWLFRKMKLIKNLQIIF